MSTHSPFGAFAHEVTTPAVIQGVEYSGRVFFSDTTEEIVNAVAKYDDGAGRQWTNVHGEYYAIRLKSWDYADYTGSYSAWESRISYSKNEAQINNVEDGVYSSGGTLTLRTIWEAVGPLSKMPEAGADDPRFGDPYKWTTVSVELVVIDAPGQTPATITGAGVYLEGDSVSITVSLWEGYEIDHVYNSLTGSDNYSERGENYYDDAFWAPSYDVTFIVYIRRCEYTVTFDKQGGTGGTDSVKVRYGDPMPPITIPVRTGYKFLGYYDFGETIAPVPGYPAPSHPQYYTSTGQPTDRRWYTASDGTLFADWRENAGTGKLIYDPANGRLLCGRGGTLLYDGDY